MVDRAGSFNADGCGHSSRIFLRVLKQDSGSASICCANSILPRHEPNVRAAGTTGAVLANLGTERRCAPPQVFAPSVSGHLAYTRVAAALQGRANGAPLGMRWIQSLIALLSDSCARFRTSEHRGAATKIHVRCRQFASDSSATNYSRSFFGPLTYGLPRS
jgi:hypothetical protein